MPRQRDHQAIASAVLLDAHRFVEKAADEAINRISAPAIARPTEPRHRSDVRQAAKVPPHIHAAVLAAAAELGSRATLPYPPTEEGRLTDEELAALGALKLVPAARSALQKIVRSAASAPLFHFLCLLDAVGDPEGYEDGPWLPVNFTPAAGDAERGMLHDDFIDAFHEYAARRPHR